MQNFKLSTRVKAGVFGILKLLLSVKSVCVCVHPQGYKLHSRDTDPV